MSIHRTAFDAIILAGGFGARLKSITGELPKPLADVCGKPFLAYLMDYLVEQGFARIILSTGYRHDLIVEAFGNSYRGVPVCYIPEESPLGTGGAIRESFRAVKSGHVAVVNGDTFFAVNLGLMLEQHMASGALMTIALKPMSHFNRYGAVTVEGTDIRGFEEKGMRTSGYINGGVYWLDRSVRSLFDACGIAFSLEKDLLQKQLGVIRPAAYISDGYFVDIGIPEDYKLACRELPQFFQSQERLS